MDKDAKGPSGLPSAEIAIALGQKSIDAMADLTRRNMDVMLAVAEVTNQGIQAVVSDMTDFSRRSLERTSMTARAMTAVTSPADLIRLQTEFAQAQFEAARAQMMKLSNSMFQTAREQLAAQAALAQRDTGGKAVPKPPRG